MRLEPSIVDDVDVEHLIPMPTRQDRPIDALRGWVGEKRLGHLIVAELSRCVG
jgi:hypothetical protein